MSDTMHHPHQLEKIPIPCGCVLHESGLILTICEKDVRRVDPDRIIALMLAANAKIAAVIERIDAYDLDEEELRDLHKPLGHPDNFDRIRRAAEMITPTEKPTR